MSVGPATVTSIGRCQRRLWFSWACLPMLFGVTGPSFTAEQNPAAPRVVILSVSTKSHSTPISIGSAISPSCSEVDIDLATAFAKASTDNPTIALAIEAIRTAEAERLAANAMMFPTVRVGADFDCHRGELLSARGIIRDVNRQSAFAGAGTLAVGQGTVAIPGVRILADLADAWFEPRIARQNVTEIQSNPIATNNTILLDVAVSYFALLGAEARLQALLATRDELQKLAKQTTDFSNTGQGKQADADRSQSEFQLIQVQVEAAQEQISVAAAELARLLHQDPSVRLRAIEPLAIMQLVPLNEPLDQLIQRAISARAEVRAKAAAIAAAAARTRQETVRPFVPVLSLGYSAGVFGGGSNLVDTNFGHFSGRGDFDAMAFWSLDNLGIGNLAVQRRRRAEFRRAQSEQVMTIDQIRREVADAYAIATARQHELEAARRGLASAERGYRTDAERSRNLEGLPIELLNSIDLLAAARLDVIRTIVEFDQAQFRLFAGLGYPPSAPPRH